MQNDNEIRAERLKKLADLRSSGYEAPYEYSVTHRSMDLQKKYAKLASEEKTTDETRVAGRVMLKRWMGSVIFMTLADESGQIQLYFSKNDLGEQFMTARRDIELGDIIGVHGLIFKTKKGELSIWVKDFEILTKSLTGLADKYHGLRDIELKYRNRSLDMVMDADSRAVLVKRYQITRAIREFMFKENFLEVETPITQIHYGGAAARPFTTHHHTLDLDMYLRVSPEQYLKRLLAGGLEAVFEIGKSFRNENIDRTHNPEFTMLEAYRAYKDYNYCMDLLERMVEYVCDTVFETRKFSFGEHKIEFARPWKRLSVIDGLKELANINVESMSDEELYKRVGELKKEFHQKSRGEAILILFEEFCEEKIIQPTHVIDYPKESTPFARLHRSESELIERFESFVAGSEIANAYSELNDAVRQRELLEAQTRMKKDESDEVWGDVDEEFLEALELGMPPAAGIGVGIDRLSMLLLNRPSIRDIIFFPTMKPRHDEAQ